MGVDVLITGHTHQLKISKLQDKIIINPGSVTGAFSPICRLFLRIRLTPSREPVPSFVLIEFKEDALEIFSYQLIGGKI